jgi:hypothetical protein
MGFLDGKPMVFYHQGDSGGGPDVAAHRVDHRTLVKDLPKRLEGKTVREKRALRPTIRRAVRSLMISAEVTGGDAITHRDVAVEQVNHWLPRYQRISARHIRQKP